MKKRIKAPFYTIQKACLASCFRDTTLPNGYLYSKGLFRTKITADDLPDHYIEGTVFKVDGFISVKGIKYIEYKPNYRINHMHRDDYLYVSYDEPIEKVVGDFGRIEYNNYDAILWGGMILTFIRAIRKYKSFDIEPIAEEVKKKEKFFLEKYPEECRFIGKSYILE